MESRSQGRHLLATTIRYRAWKAAKGNRLRPSTASICLILSIVQGEKEAKMTEFRYVDLRFEDAHQVLGEILQRTCKISSTPSSTTQDSLISCSIYRVNFFRSVMYMSSEMMK
ncbi:unnamed protein product [Lactuca virosa]|uniref:Uncharacterized protein n=1 Tax=Lactuca virosa TaxID=75947 RepID=A0AAU9NQK2_9ASTR|nr:unnamed protein product [Lactuca virosa]